MAYTLQSSPPSGPIHQQPPGSPPSAPIPMPASVSSSKLPSSSPYPNLSSSPYDGNIAFPIENNNAFSENPYPTTNTFSNLPYQNPNYSTAPTSRPSSAMHPLEESDHEFDDSASHDTNNFAPRSYSPVNANVSKKRYSAIYDSVTITNLAAAAAASGDDDSILLPPRPFGHRKSASVSSNSSSLLDSLLDTNFGKNIPDSKHVQNENYPTSSSLAPPQYPSSNPLYSIHPLNKKSSWYSTASQNSSISLNNPALIPPSSLASKSSYSSLNGSYPVNDSQNNAFLLPLPPFANGSSRRSHHRPSASIGSIGSANNFYSIPPANGSNISVHSVASVNSNYSAASTNLPSYPTDHDVASLKVPSRSNSPIPDSSHRENSPAPYQPFNFQSTTMALGVPTTTTANRAPAGANQRRGHKYKHSSVSMNFFKEDVRLPLAIPASLPIPTLKECQQSMSRDQAIRVLWSAFHLFVAFLIYIVDSPYTALAALAHLLFYDAMGALLCSVVDILGNFDVWKRSTVHLPFGLERTEVLAGYALSISLIFMGGDIMSHSIQDIVQAIYLGSFLSASHSHGAISRPQEHSVTDGHGHGHGFSDSPDNVDWNVIVFRVVLGIFVTIVSAVGFDNHSRIARALRNGYNGSAALNSLPSFLSNPSHFITVTFSVAILLYPFESPIVRRISDTLLTPIIAVSMCYVGWSLAKSLGGMLVMSFPGENRVENVTAEIAKLPHVAKVQEVSVWQVHHSVWLACMKIEMNGGNAQDESIVRSEASRLVKDIMNEGFETQYADDGLDRQTPKPNPPSFTADTSAPSLYYKDTLPTSNKRRFGHAKKNSVSAFAKDSLARLKAGGATLTEPIRWEATIDITRTKNWNL